MSNNEIVKLLRRGMFSDLLLQIAADAIEELETDNTQLRKQLEEADLAQAEEQQEHEKWISEQNKLFKEMLDHGRKIAILTMQDRLHENTWLDGNVLVVAVDYVDQVATELLEED